MDSANADAGREPTRDAHPSIWLRVWLWIPDAVFRILGLAFFLALFGHRLSGYFDKGFWRVGHFYETAGGAVLYLPFARILIDATYLLIALAFVFRIAPIRRADRAREIFLPLTAAFWPFIPFAVEAVARAVNAHWLAGYQAFMFPARFGPGTFFLGFGLILLGNALDVWSYAVLFRSLSIVAEARALKVRGPYRLVRHPIYLGQMLAQAGVWLCYANTHAVWIAFYLVFVAMQLYRSWVEDQVLARAFGPRHAEWKRKAWWFF